MPGKREETRVLRGASTSMRKLQTAHQVTSPPSCPRQRPRMTCLSMEGMRALLLGSGQTRTTRNLRTMGRRRNQRLRQTGRIEGSGKLLDLPRVKSCGGKGCERAWVLAKKSLSNSQRPAIPETYHTKTTGSIRTQCCS